MIYHCHVCKKVFKKNKGLKIHNRLNKHCMSLRNKFIFNNEQKEFITSGLIDLKLYGNPGVGKTRTIIGHVKFNLDNQVYENGNSYLILMFNNMAKNDFIKKANGLIHNISHKNVKTLHSLAGTIVTSLTGKNSKSKNTIILSAIKLLQNDYSLKNISCLKTLKYIFIY